MNYAGNEEVREDLKKLTESAYELFRKASEFEQKYKWNKASLVERLTGAAVGNVKDDLAEIYKQIAVIEHQFQE